VQRLIVRRFKDITWYSPAGKGPLLESLEDLDKFFEETGAVVLKKGRRKSFACLETTFNGVEVYLKTFRLKGIFPRLKHWFFKSKALKELEVSLVARERGIPVVLPLAAGERRQGGLLQESYLLIQKLPGAIDLLEYLRQGGIPHGHKARVIEALGRLARETHEGGVLQEDFSLNNFLLVNPQDVQTSPSYPLKTADATSPARSGEDGHICLIDFERTRVHQRLPTKQREWTLAKLNRIGADFTLSDKFRFLRAYCKTKGEFRDLPRWRNLERYTHQILKGDAQRISTASAGGGRGYKSYKDSKLTAYFLEGYSLEELIIPVTNQEIAEEQRGQYSVLKCRGRIRRGTVEEAVLIYEFNARQKKRPVATRAWQWANGLRKGYFPVTPPVAAIEWNQEEGYGGTLILKELEEAEDIRELLHKCPPSSDKRHSVLWHVARFLSRLHNFGTFAEELFPGDVSWVGGQKPGYKVFLTHPFNFVMQRRLEDRDRETDLKRLEGYLADILGAEEKAYLRAHYLKYSSVIT
jgi:hypothetical protein